MNPHYRSKHRPRPGNLGEWEDVVLLWLRARGRKERNLTIHAQLAQDSWKHRKGSLLYPYLEDTDVSPWHPDFTIIRKGPCSHYFSQTSHQELISLSCTVFVMSLRRTHRSPLIKTYSSLPLYPRHQH